MLWSGKAIADVPFLCYRIERVEYFTQNDKDVVMFAFQGFSLGIQLSEIQQLVNQFQQIVGILFPECLYDIRDGLRKTLQAD